MFALWSLPALLGISVLQCMVGEGPGVAAGSARAPAGNTSRSMGLLWHARRQGSNPLKMGVPKRVPSLNTQVEGKCRELGGINAIHRCAACPPTAAACAPSRRVLPGWEAG